MTLEEAYVAYLVLFGRCLDHNEWDKGEQDFLCGLIHQSSDIRANLAARFSQIDLEDGYSLANAVWNLFYTHEFRKRYGHDTH